MNNITVTVMSALENPKCKGFAMCRTVKTVAEILNVFTLWSPVIVTYQLHAHRHGAHSRSYTLSALLIIIFLWTCQLKSHTTSGAFLTGHVIQFDFTPQDPCVSFSCGACCVKRAGLRWFVVYNIYFQNCGHTAPA